MNDLLAHLRDRERGGASDLSVVFEGWPVGWTLALAILLAAIVWVGYRFGAPDLSRRRRLVLVALRTAFFTVLFLLLTRPVLLLTVNETLRGEVMVLIDDSRSMGLADARTAVDDRRRAALATGALATGDDTLTPPDVGPLSRTDLVRRLAENGRLNLWQSIHRQSDLAFFSFGRDVTPLGHVGAGDDPARKVPELLAGLQTRGETSALGDALRALLDSPRGRTATGIVVISDGSVNGGSPPTEEAALAAERGVPLYVYGTGITNPKDLAVREITGPRGVFQKEYIEYAVRVRVPAGFGPLPKLVLREEDRVVAEKDLQDLVPAEGGEITVPLGYTAEKAGTFRVSAALEPQPGEASTENNSASTRLRVLDDRLNVLYLEQEPRWDFRYLLATLERDPRLRVQCLLFDGDPVPPGEEGKPFLVDFPASRADLVANAVIVLGDVNPRELGQTRMEAIRSWVADLGGAMIFLAGPKNNPFRYAGTPLEALLPVELNPSLTETEWKKRAREPIPLLLTPAGELSPMLRLAPDPEENRRLWKAFPGVRWTARVAAAKPGATVLVEDTRTAARDGALPVVATMPYGQGGVLYFGFDETFRWRSRVGEKYYTAVWNQIVQQFAIDRRLASSPRIQVQPDRPDYATGTAARLSGRIYDADFQPLTEDSVPATLTVRTEYGRELPLRAMRFLPLSGRPGEYELTVETPVAGTYAVALAVEPEAPVTFEVRNPSVEMAETAMNEPLLRALAQASRGAFFREETLAGLPEVLQSRQATLPVAKKLEPAYSPWWLGLLLVLLTTEWVLRRKWSLK